MIEFELTQDHRDLVERVREFAGRELAPNVAANDRAEHFDPAVFEKLAEMGLTGICLPERYGGSGMDYISLGLACEELDYVDTSIRTALSVHMGLCALDIYTWGNEEQRQRFLPRLASGELIGCFGLTEPDAGSDVAGMRSTARRVDGGWAISGQKVWVSLADYADVLLIFAYTGDRSEKHRGISGFIMERDKAGKGLVTTPIKHKLGLRAGDTGIISMDDAFVPEENLLGEPGEGFKVAMSSLDNGRFTVAAGAAGTIRAALDASVAYCHSRKTFGQEIGRYQLVQQMIAKMVRDYEITRLLYLRAGSLKNKGTRSTQETAMAKWYGCDAAFNAAHDAIEIHGAYGYSGEYPVERLLRNSRAPIIYEGTREIQTIMQAEYALGYREDRPVRRSLPAWPDTTPD
ncbi:MAG: acyl-CoA dehydrogenase family protein [Candidatus Dormibacteria bacterium]